MTVPSSRVQQGAGLLDRWRGTLLFLRSKRIPTTLIAAASAIILTRSFITFMVEISIEPTKPIRFVNMPELVPFCFSVVCNLAIAPRFVEWERLGDRRYRLHVTALAVACLVMPQLVLAASLPALPARTPTSEWVWTPFNLLVWSSLALVLAAFVGHILSAGLTVLLFAGAVVVQNVAGPIIGWFPISSGGDPTARWHVASICAVLSVVIYVGRAGSGTTDAVRRRNAD